MVGGRAHAVKLAPSLAPPLRGGGADAEAAWKAYRACRGRRDFERLAVHEPGAPIDGPAARILSRREVEALQELIRCIERWKCKRGLNETEEARDEQRAANVPDPHDGSLPHANGTDSYAVIAQWLPAQTII